MKNLKVNFKWHFYLLGLILINFGIEWITGYRLNQNLTFILKIILYATGVYLFFKTIRPFKKISIYFSFYPISVILIGFFFLFGGIFLAILSSLAINPIAPKHIKYKSETIKIYDRFQGFMASCCSYEVVEPKFYLFEKHLGYIKIEKVIDPKKDTLSLVNGKIIYKHKIANYLNQTKIEKDTTEILSFE